MRFGGVLVVSGHLGVLIQKVGSVIIGQGETLPKAFRDTLKQIPHPSASRHGSSQLSRSQAYRRHTHYAFAPPRQSRLHDNATDQGQAPG
jgi:hypothetical protein